ncbi:unnamed protein product, partial [marine sediment metagenome]
MSDSDLIYIIGGLIIGFCIYQSGILEILINNLSETDWYMIGICFIIYFAVTIIQIELKIQRNRIERNNKDKLWNFYFKKQD